MFLCCFLIACGHGKFDGVLVHGEPKSCEFDVLVEQFFGFSFLFFFVLCQFHIDFLGMPSERHTCW